MYIITGSVTSAIRLSRVVENYTGTPAVVVHTPSEFSNGCSYSVKSDIKSTHEARKLAAQAGVTIKGLYSEKYENGKRVYYDIS